MKIEEMIAVLEHAKKGGRVEHRLLSNIQTDDEWDLVTKTSDWDFSIYDYRPLVEKHYIDGKLVEVGARFWSLKYQEYVIITKIHESGFQANDKNGLEFEYEFNGDLCGLFGKNDLRAFKPLILEGTELKVGDEVDSKSLPFVPFQIAKITESQVFFDAVTHACNHEFFVKNFTRTAPKKTWWVNRYMRNSSEKRCNAYTNKIDLEYARNAIMDSDYWSLGDAVEVMAATREDALQIALAMPWPEEFKVRTIKREELPISFHVKLPLGGFVTYHGYDSIDIKDRVLDGNLWSPVTDKALKDIGWYTFQVREYPDGHIEKIKAEVGK